MKKHMHIKFNRLIPRLLFVGLITLIVQLVAFAAEGRLVNGNIHSAALEGNLLGDSADRAFIVYLPHSYDTSPSKRYPVVYLLHGSRGQPSSWTGGYMNLKAAVDASVAEGRMREIIFVMPHANNRYGGSWYLSSKTIGDYETYIVEELVNHIDANYRTIAHRSSRGISGYSMGGYGSMHLALKYPEVFGVVASLAGQYDKDSSWKERLESAARANPKNFTAFAGLSFPAESGFAIAAGVSPNPTKPPFFLDLPFELVGGKLQVVPEVWERYAEADILHGHLDRYLQQPVRLSGIMIVHGISDGSAHISQARALDTAMTNLGINHVLEEHGGGHSVGDPANWLQFLSDNLEFLPIVDFNGDGIVDCADMCIMFDHWGENYPLCDIGPTPFGFGDGIVDTEDLIVLAEHLFTYPGAVAYWNLDETEGDIAYNSIGDNHGILSGNPTWQPDAGQVAGALEFDGVNDYISTDFVLNPEDGTFSVFAWIKGGVPGQVVLSQMGGARWLCADPSEGNLMTDLKGTGRLVTQPLVSEFIVTDGNWHRIGLVWDGSHRTRTLYVDDVAVAEDEQTNLAASENGLYIGTGTAMEPGSFWSGLIDDVRIYNRAVTP